MYRASREFEEDPDVPVELLLDVVWRVQDYPEFVKGVKRVQLLEQGESEALARFVAGVAGMEFEYTLRCERTPSAVRWRRVAGAFRAAEGSLVHLGGRRFRYENAMDPGFSVPEFAVRFVLERSLPRLIREFRQRARARVRLGA